MATSGGMETRYFLTDHLGSVRQVVAADGSVLEQNDYYPFGKRWTTASTPLSDNRHRFSGKEEQAFLNLPYLDFGTRMYNPDWGRWFTPDPLAHKYYAWSTYCYCIGNPVRFTDKKGESIKDAVVGCIIGAVTNIIPGTTGMRDSYVPTDAADYNNALQTTDALAAVSGAILSDSGEKMMTSGIAVGSLAVGITMGTAGASAEVTVPLAAIGEGAALTGLGVKAIGVTLLGNSSDNASQGYNRGKEKVEPAVSSKEKQYKRISPNQMKDLKKKGFDPHENKPSQGKNSGGKIDYYKDKDGNIYYKAEHGENFEPINENINNF